MNKCIGCGATLQSDDKEKIGYVRKELEKENMYCERCFRLIHYNEGTTKSIAYTNEEIVQKINEKHVFTFFLVDFLTMSKEVFTRYHQIHNPKCVLFCKADILPKSIKKENIVSFLKEEYQIKEPIYFISSKKGYGLSNIETLFSTEAILAGFTNAGKSTLLNTLLKENRVTVSYKPNTTLDLIAIPVHNKILYDTPGFTLENTMAFFLENEYKKLEIKKEIKPTTYQIKKDASLLFEDKIRLENLSEKNSWTIYMSGNFSWDQAFPSQNKLKEKESRIYSLKENSDFVFLGVGFIRCKKACQIKVYADHFAFEVRNSIFKK